MINNIIIEDTSNNPEVLQGDYQYTIYTYNNCLFDIVGGSDIDEVMKNIGKDITDIIREDLSITYQIEWKNKSE